MAFAFNVFFPRPLDHEREQQIIERAALHGGHLAFRTESGDDVPESISNYIMILFEFDTYDAASAAAASIRKIGEHVEGPFDY